MDRDFALKLAADIGIDIQQVIREEIELIFLAKLFDSSISDRLIFKGGTALRLVYESPRFSEDLDFSITGEINTNEFKKVVTGIVKSDDRFSIKDLAGKHYTNLAQISIKEPWRETSFSIKIEISRRIEKREGSPYTNMLAKSLVTNISVMMRLLTLKEMLQDKLQAIKARKMPRDIFDIWYICQRLNTPFNLRGFGYTKGKIRQELRKYLPKKYYPIVDDLERLNA